MTHTHTHTHTTTTTPSLGLPWTRDRPVAEIYTRQHTEFTQTSMLAAAFEPTLPASEWPQTHVRPPGSAILITNPTNLGRYVGVWVM